MYASACSIVGLVSLVTVGLAYENYEVTALHLGSTRTCSTTIWTFLRGALSTATRSKMAKSEPKDGLPVYPFASPTDFETFLEKNQSTLPGLHLKLAKKSSGIQSITAPEAVEVALCFGWIDGRASSLDEKYWLVRYTPRRAKSIWSQKNVETVARLIEQNRMRESGLQAVEAAKRDGRWDSAYAGPATIQVPDDLTQKLEEEPAAKAFFQGLNKSQRYSVLWSVETTSARNRPKRIDALVQMLAMGKLPGAAVKEKVKSVSSASKKRVGNGRTKVQVSVK